MDGRSLGFALKTRANIFHTRSIIASHLERPPRDWDSLEILVRDNADSNPELKKDLTTYLAGELENNYKVLSFYELSNESASSFQKLVAKLSVISGTYPEVFGGTVLSSMSQQHTVVSAVQGTDQSRLVLTRRRTFSLRKKIDRSVLDGGAQTALGIYDDVYGVADYHWQTFDILTLDHTTGLLELRIDYTRSESSYQNNKQIDTSLGEAIGWAVYNCSLHKLKFSSGTPKNLFPAISYFTFTPEGHISKLSFMSPQGGIKNDTMRKGEDLRQETFYSNGLSAVGGQITPFDISVIWHVTNQFGPGQEIELTIPSTVAVATAGSAAVQTYAIVRFCSTEADTAHLTKKLIEAL